jgi:1-acyl-sn-glycerol-3-phosphate acyltransferase/acyl carrier protein
MLLPAPDEAQQVRTETVLTGDDPVGRAIATVAKVPSVRSDQTLGQLGLDSLSIAQLAVEIEEKSGRAIADGDLLLDLTVEQVRERVAAAPPADEAYERTADETAGPPTWPYTWGHRLRWLSFPFDLIYRYGVTRTYILGAEHLSGLQPPVIFAGAHHGFADLPLVRYSLSRSPARDLAKKLMVVAAGAGAGFHDFFTGYGVLAFGIIALEREYGRSASLHRLSSLIEAGYPALYFPQGTHARPAQEKANDPAVRFRPGIGLLAESTGASVVPFGLAGTDIVMPPFKEEFHGMTIAGVPVSLKPGPLAIAYGPPLRVDPAETHEAFAERLQTACYGLTRLAEQALVADRAGAVRDAEPAISRSKPPA